MRIALIDDGIEPCSLPDGKVLYDLSVREDGLVRARPPEERILTDHGTTCARIIAKYAPQAEFCSLRVFHQERLRTSCDQLVSALSWCLAKRVPLVHMSVGSSLLNDYPRIRPVIARMLGQGQTVVAACSNAAPYSMPACLGGVLGVAADGNLTRFSYVAGQSWGGAVLSASSRHTLELAPGQAIITPVSNSYAAPTVTAAACNILSQHAPFSLSMPGLYREMTGDAEAPLFRRPDFIEDAVVLNLSGQHLLKNHFFFDCRHEFASEENWEGSGLRDHSLVYLPPRAPSHSSCAPGLFLEHASPAASLLYGGPLPPGVRPAARDRLVWSEDISSGAAEARGGDGDARAPGCPVVYILGVGTEPVDLTCRLRDRFVKDEYQCACLCDHPFSYLYGLLPIPQAATVLVGIADAAERYDPDVILCCLSLAGHRPLLSEDEFEVVFAGPGSSQAGLLSPNRWSMLLDFTESDVDGLYQRICRHFT